MLILRRKKSESILIGDNIRITVVDCAADGVRLAIDAPKQISILREELSKAELENKSSVAPDFDTVSDLQNTLLARLKGISSSAKPVVPNTEQSAAAETDESPETPETDKATEMPDTSKDNMAESENK